MNKNEQQQPTQLNPESFAAIAGAFSRLSQLGDNKISTPGDNTAVEREKLIEFLATQFLQHAPEFIASYSLTHTEYLPLLNALRKVATRAGFFSPLQPPQPTRPENN